MECRDFRALLSAWIDGEVQAGEAREIEAHLESCPACRDAADAFRALDGTAQRIEGAVPADFREKLFARLEAESLLPKRPSLFAYAFRWLAVPAAVAAALALFLLTSRDAGRTPSGIPGPAPPRVARPAPDVSAPPREPGSGSAGTDAERRVARDEGSAAKTPVPPPVSEDVRRTARGPSPETAVRGAGDLSPEDREIVANLDIVEGPAGAAGDDDTMDMLFPPERDRG